MRSKRRRILRAALAFALFLGASLQPALVRCVDAAGHESIEVPGADCCTRGQSADTLVLAARAAGDCVDLKVTVPALKRPDHEALSQPGSTFLVYSRALFMTSVASTRGPSVLSASARVAYLAPPAHLTSQLNC